MRGWVLVMFQFGGLLWEAATTSTAAGATVAGGLFHTCVIVSDLSLRCFGGGSADEVSLLAPSGSVINGFGNFGQIGSGSNETLGDEDGEMGSDLVAVDLGENTVQEVAAGQSHTCVLLTSGSVACFGFNLYGQLGLGDTASRGLSSTHMGEGLAFVDLGEGRTATHISCGQYTTCAVLDNGDLKCWGNNEKGMLGLGDTVHRGDEPDTMGDNLQPVDLGTGQTAVAVDGGRYHTCAILGNGGVKCWGGYNGTDHNYGQLGQENTFDIGAAAGQMGDNLPEIDLGTGRTAVALACGWFHTCVILDNAKMHCFGRNFDGQLGLGDTEDRGYQTGSMGDAMASVDLGDGRYPVALATGRWHTCALLDNDDVKCFGANTADDLGAGQLGLEDSANRGISLATTGEALEPVELGTGRVAGWIFAAFDHNCVIFSDLTMKCWGLNKSGQLGVGDTDDRGAEDNTMGDNLPVVQAGLRLASPPSPAFFDRDDLEEGEDGGGLSTEWTVAASLLGAGGAVFVVGAICLCCRRRLQNQGVVDWKGMSYVKTDGDSASRRKDASGDAVETGERVTFQISTDESRGDTVTGVAPFPTTKAEPKQPRQQLVNYPPEHRRQQQNQEQRSRSDENRHGSSISGRDVGMAAAGTAGMAIAGGLTAGWNVIGVVAENLPWIGVAYHMLNEIADIVDTRNAMQGNMEKIKNWAVSLQDVLVQMAKQMQLRPAVNARSLEHMSTDVISTMQTLVDTVGSYNAKGTLAQYAASRSCQKAVDAADTALRGALVKLSVGQGAELMSMVGRLQDAGLVVDEKLDMIIEHLRKQEENAARLELRLAEYSESMAEVLGQFAKSNAAVDSRGKGLQLGQAGKTLRALGEEQLDKLQISKDDVSYPSNLPFASGTYSEVYQVIHEGVIKAAKKTNLARLGVGGKDVNRVFGRFVKELYILSQMHSDRVVSVYGAIASPTELTLVMEFVERGSIRTILDDDAQRKTMTPAVKHGLLVDTAAGMTYLYNNGVEHRDLKSANCLVTHDWRVKISDFGLSNTNDAISTGSSSTMSSNFRGGTMVYMAPELLPGGAGREVPAELSDVYSFGVVVWDVVCGDGETPWAGVSVNELPLTLKMGTRLDIPAQCARFYRKLMLNCWRQDPHRRPNFDRVLISVKKEAELSSPATPTASVPTQPASTQHGLPSSPAAWPRTTRKSSAPTVGAIPPPNSGTTFGAEVGQNRSWFTSTTKSAGVADLPKPGDASLRLHSAKSADSAPSSFVAGPSSRYKSTRSAESLTPQAAYVMSSSTERNRVTATPSKPPGRFTKRTSSTGGHDAARPEDIPPDRPLRVPRTLSLESGTISRPIDDELATSGGRASQNAKVRGRTPPRQHRTRNESKEWTGHKAKTSSHRPAKGTDPVQIAVKGVGSGLSSAPGRKVAPPAVDGRESRQPAESSHEVQSPRKSAKRSGGDQAWAVGFEAVGGDGAEGGEGAGAGRDGGGGGHVRAKNDQKVQVLHGFRLVTPAGDGGEALTGGGVSGTISGVRGKEKRRGP